MAGKRRDEISLLNVFLCVLVIWIHVSSGAVSGVDRGAWQGFLVYVPWRLAAFVVQGFLFLGGLRLFLHYNGKRDYGRYYLGRAKRILAPYILWNVIFYLWFIAIGYFGFSIKALGVYILNGTLVSPFYFVVTITQFYLLTPLWDRMCERVHPAVGLTFSLMVMELFYRYLPTMLGQAFPGFEFAYNDRVFTTYLFYWAAGCFAGRYYDKFLDIVRTSGGLLGVMFLLCAGADAGLGYLQFRGGVWFPYLEELHILYCMSAIGFSYYLALRLTEGRRLESRLFQLADRSSYLIFLSHCFTLQIVNAGLRFLGISSLSMSYLARIVGVYGITFALCMAYTAGKEALARRKKAF